MPFDISWDIFVSTSRHFLLNFCNVSRSIGLIAGPAPTIWKTILAKVFCFNLTIRGRYWWGANRPKTVNGSIVRCPFLSCQILHPWRILGCFSNCRTSVSRAESKRKWRACHLRFHFVAASSEEWWMGVCASQLRMPLKYLPIRPSIKCSLGRCKLKDQTIFLEEASTKRTTWFKIAQY